MQKRNFYSYLFLVVFIIGGFYFLYTRPLHHIVYVDDRELFDNFNMSKELKKEGEKELRGRKSQLDSLQFLLKIASDDKNKSLLMKQYIEKRQEVEDFQNAFMQSNTEKIWSRIAEYSKVYAEQKGYDFVIGANGKDQILYGNSDVNITKQLLNFINKKYDGFQ